MTNTERLIKNFEHCESIGVHCRFAVGRYTGNGTSMVAALRRRGYTLTKLRGPNYEMTKA